VSARKRILLVANNFPPTVGGSATVYGNLAASAGGEIVVLAPSRHYSDGMPIIGWREHDRRASYTVIRLPLLRTVLSRSPSDSLLGRFGFVLADVAGRFGVLREVLRAIRTHDIGTVCIGELLASGWIIHFLRRFARVGTAVYVHGEELTQDDAYDADRQRARKGLDAAQRIFVVSPFTYETVCKLSGPAAAERLVLIENGVDTGRFRPLGRRPDLVARYGLEGRFVFVSVCRLVEKKGIDHALRAFAPIAQADPSCRFLVVGSGPQAPELRAIADELGITASVIFAGAVQEADIVAHYCLGDVFVMPNRVLPNGDTEGFGLVFLEANACGLPVIGGIDGGTASAIIEGENGLRVSGHDIAAIRTAMLRLRQDDALRDAMRVRGFEMAKRADWSAKATTFVSVCRTISR
jgi:phosphatidylinositol alpha-1,6-mannosyltransferase